MAGVGAELRVTFLGEHQDARKSVAALDQLLKVIGKAEELNTGQKGHSTWRFSHLALGSVAVGIELFKPPAEGGPDVDRFAFDRLVDGLAEAQEREGVPGGWSTDLAIRARDWIRDVGTEGIRIEIRRNGFPERSVTVTKVAQRHLDAGLERGWQDSIGSIIGALDTVSVHGKYEARLWPERGGLSVPVQFQPDQVELVKEHLGARVEATGWLRRDTAGRPVQLRLRDLERLRSFKDSPPLSGLIGLDPDFTGGKSAVEYLKEIRGEAR